MINLPSNFNYKLVPVLSFEDYKLVESYLEDYFTVKIINNIVCEECSERCVRQVFQYEDSTYYDCPTGYIDLREKVNPDKLEKYKFKIEHLLKQICDKNNIRYYYNKINSKIVLFGEKEVQKTNYKFFYAIWVFTNKQLNEDVIYKIKSCLQPTDKVLILTPQDFILQNKDIDFLNQNNCRILGLNKLLDTDLMIEELVTSDNENLKELIKSKKLVIINSKSCYLFGYKLDLFPKLFKLLEYLASRPWQDINKDECIDYIWKNEIKKDKFKDYDKLFYDTRYKLNKAFYEAGVPKSLYNELIPLKDKIIRLNLKDSDIYI